MPFFLFRPGGACPSGQAHSRPAVLAAKVKTVEGKLPSQSHTMQDVSYHFGNLWFAGQHENWDLAEFYW